MSSILDFVSIENLLLSMTSNAILVVDQSGRISQANTPAELMFGYPSGALNSQPLTMLIPERLRNSYQQRVAKYFSDPSPRVLGAGMMLTGLRQDGKEFSAEINLNPLPTQAGIQVLAVIRNVSAYRQAHQIHMQATAELQRQVEIRNLELLQANTELHRQIIERARAELSLRETEALYRQLVENQPDLICRFLPNTTLTFVNAAYACFFGKQSKELIGKRFIDFLSIEEQTEVLKQLAFLTPSEPSRQYEHKSVRADGVLRWHLWHDFAFFDHQGDIIGFQSVGVDITKRKEAEEALFEAKERAQITLHSIGDAVITTDDQAIVDYLNPVAETLTGWTMAEAQGRPLNEVFRIINEQSRETVPDPVARCIQEGKIIGLAKDSMLINRLGQEYHIDDTAAPIRGRNGEVLGAVLVFHDVTEHRQLARQLEYDATHDALTGLINRSEFERRLDQALTSAQKYGMRHALCYLDLDQFKIVNDTAGHAAGDELLRQVKTTLSGMFRKRDTLARIGGDEFGLLFENCPLDNAQVIAQTVLSRIRDLRFHWDGRTYQIGGSIGLAPITGEAQDTTQLLTWADIACYTAKELGRNRVHIYQQEDNDTIKHHNEILGAAELLDSLEQGRFRLHYQPIVPLKEPILQPTRYEALLRVAHKSNMDDNIELLLPAAFIPAAERYGLMGAIDRWVIQATFRDYADSIGQTGAKIAINLSGNSLSDETTLDFIETQFAKYAFPPGQACFEITETAAIKNLRRAVELMTALKHHGSQFALDDFGSGLSSFRYLKTLPVDYLKIDGSFIKDITENPNDCAMVAAINQMSHTLGIQTIAEYVENFAISERLSEIGVDYAQGFFFGRPEPWGQ